MIMNPNAFMYAGIGIVVILFLFLLLQYFLLRNKVNRLSKKYKYFMNGEDGGSIELKLSTEVRELREMVASSENMLHQQELLATMQLQSFQKVGLVRYDAFDDTGDKLSFSLTVLDGKNNGFILSSLAGHDTSRIYAKKSGERPVPGSPFLGRSGKHQHRPGHPHAGHGGNRKSIPCAGNHAAAA